MTNLVFQNYHRHSTYTNPRVSDSVVTNKDYAIRASELGHGIISSCEHGYQGRYIEAYELAKEYGLKFVFGAEAYWVKDRLEKDRSNCHIFAAAKNENGRQAINDVLSEANITGFYGQPRLDIPLILSLPPDDVIITTACVAYWKYEDIEEITKQFYSHFGKNFFLEVQYHNTEKQSSLNKRILELKSKYDIQIIMGCDSHYIDESKNIEREDYLASKGMFYEDEQGWFLDYPDGETAYKRFANQCILSHEQILEAINNTSVFLEVEEYSNPCFTKDIKMPTLYKELAQEQKDEIYKNLVWAEWNYVKSSVPQNKWQEYETEIQKEVDIVVTTKHADYFLDDYHIVKRGIEKGGVITPSGRGSGVSFYTNKLLGFTDVDRIAANVKMYPERFMSPTRILETKSLADLDLNLGTVSIFAEAQREILGEDHAYPMLAYGTMKPKAAWKMYAKSQNVDFDLANKVSGQIEKYENALKHANEDDKEEINVLDYIEKEFHEIYKQSEKYLGVISDWKIHPCSYLLYQGSIRKEIGLVKIKENLCCIMDGKWAEDYKFLKNDLLKVSVVDLIDRVYKRIGIKRHGVNDLLSICKSDNKAWDVYKNGCTLGINQVEQTATKSRVMKYQPRNISELCAFVAAIRPGFKSMYKKFEAREQFEYGIKSFDDLIKTPEMPNSFVLYQEMAMAALNYAGIPMSECYEVIKNIAKKRAEKVLKYKEQFLGGFKSAIVKNEKRTEEAAEKLSHDIWQILEDSVRYSFNASHSYCVAIDSLFGAYLKSYYPLQFYEVFLGICEENGEKDRLNEAKEEAEGYFGIRFPPYKFRQDNRTISADEANNSISKSLSSIKGFSNNVSQILYSFKENEYALFVDLLRQLSDTQIQSPQIDKLITIDYFSEFGNSKELTEVKRWFDILKQGKAKQLSRDHVTPELFREISGYISGEKKDGTPSKSYTVLDMNALLNAIEQHIKQLGLDDASYQEKMQNQLEILGYVDLTTNCPEDRRRLLVMDTRELKSNNGDTWGWAIFTRSIGTGKSARLTLRHKTYLRQPISKSDIVYAKDVSKNKSGYWYLNEYTKIS